MHRIAVWAIAGLLVAGLWAVAFPTSTGRMRDVGLLVSVTCPIAIAGRHYPISVYEALAANFFTYALVGLIVESLRQKLFKRA